MKAVRYVGVGLIIFGLVAIVSEILGYSLLIYYGKAIGGVLGILGIILGILLITLTKIMPDVKGKNPLELYILLIDTFNEYLGIGVGWFTTLMVLVVFTNVVMRYIFGGELDPQSSSLIFRPIVYAVMLIRFTLTFTLETVGLPVPTGAILALQDMSWYVFGVIFLIGAAYTLQHDRHVRVDIFYVNYAPKTKTWINMLGTIFFLIPFCLLGMYVAWPFVERAFVIQETSPDAGGLAARYLAKSMIPLGFFLILLQGISLIFKSFLQITGKLPLEEQEGAH